MNTLLIFMFLMLTGAPSAFSQTEIEIEKPKFDHTHKLLTEVLKNFVISDGQHSTVVNYKELKENPQSLNNYLSSLSGVKNDEFIKWSKDQRLSFWINAYNAFTLKLIIDHYPVDSIKDIGGFFSSPWKKEFFELFGKKYYLDKIEHDIIRKRFNEPRIHFAINCASTGCPALNNEAFVPEKLNDQLETQTKIFLQDKSRNFINEKDKTIHLSKIFDWFDDDFEKDGKTIQEFIYKYMKTEINEEEFKTYDIEHTKYDWSLNKVKS